MERGISAPWNQASHVAAAWSLALALVPLVGPGGPVFAATPDHAPRFERIVVVVIENQSFADIFEKNPAAHYILDELTPASALATRFYTPKRNSPTAYFAMTSGFTYTEGDGGRWAGKCGPSLECSARDLTVFEQLVDAGGSWRVYSEDQTEPCQTTNVAKYWVGHNPAVWYPALGPNRYSSTGDGTCRAYDVSFTELRADLSAGTMPAYSLVIPNNCHNMHDACYPIHDRVMQGDAWLEGAMANDDLVSGGLIRWAQANDALLVITYDEARLATDREGCCPYRKTGGGGHVPTWVIGPPDKVRAGGRSHVPLSNFAILRTIEENWDLPLLGGAADPATAGLDSLLIGADEKQGVIPFPAGVAGTPAPSAAAQSVWPSWSPGATPPGAPSPQPHASAGVAIAGGGGDLAADASVSRRSGAVSPVLLAGGAALIGALVLAILRRPSRSRHGDPRRPPLP